MDATELKRRLMLAWQIAGQENPDAPLVPVRQVLVVRHDPHPPSDAAGPWSVSFEPGFIGANLGQGETEEAALVAAMRRLLTKVRDGKDWLRCELERASKRQALIEALLP